MIQNKENEEKIMNRVFAVDWYDETETGEIVASGTTIFAGSPEYRRAKWDAIVAEHTACFLRSATMEELYSFRDKWKQ
jgi:hypothetical protein